MQKNLNQILESGIQGHIKKIIYYEQVVFILEMGGWFNICISLNISIIEIEKDIEAT